MDTSMTAAAVEARTGRGLAPWLERIAARQAQVRRDTGALKLALSGGVSQALSLPRRIMAGLTGGIAGEEREWQKPWFPRWPGLAARPVHDPADYPWTAALRRAWPDIRAEMLAVNERFERARYERDDAEKPWTTYYFHLQRRAFPDHLRACPRTAAALALLPTNRLHVCFSAIPPGGSLAPHTGPTNTSLTLHLGLANCAGAKLFVADRAVDYRDGELFIFDDSYVHWVEHEGEATRYTLMVTLWHPGLNALERGFLALAAGRVE